MKKVLSLLLAVVLVCSMATVAFAGDLTNTCDVCGFTSNDIGEFTAHKNAKACAICPYCKVTGCKDAEEYKAHTYICKYAGIVCDYCGGVIDSEEDFANHIDACKAKYFNIPLAKIIATIKDIISKIDFNAIINTVKDVAGKAVPVVKDLIGKIDFSNIKLPA